MVAEGIAPVDGGRGRARGIDGAVDAVEIDGLG